MSEEEIKELYDSVPEGECKTFEIDGKTIVIDKTIRKKKKKPRTFALELAEHWKECKELCANFGKPHKLPKELQERLDKEGYKEGDVSFDPELMAYLNKQHTIDGLEACGEEALYCNDCEFWFGLTKEEVEDHFIRHKKWLQQRSKQT